MAQEQRIRVSSENQNSLSQIEHQQEELWSDCVEKIHHAEDATNSGIREIETARLQIPQAMRHYEDVAKHIEKLDEHSLAKMTDIKAMIEKGES